MDITQIIITIGIVLAGLIVLWALIAGIFGYFAKRSFNKFNEDMDRKHEEFRKRHGFK